MKTHRKIFAILLTLVMLVSLSATSAWAAGLPGPGNVSVDTEDPIDLTISGTSPSFTGTISNKYNSNGTYIPNRFTLWVYDPNDESYVNPIGDVVVTKGAKSQDKTQWLVDMSALTDRQPFETVRILTVVVIDSSAGLKDDYTISSPKPYQRTPVGYPNIFVDDDEGEGVFDLYFGDPPYAPTDPEDLMLFDNVQYDSVTRTYTADAIYQDPTRPWFYPNIFAMSLWSYEENGWFVDSSGPPDFVGDNGISVMAFTNPLDDFFLVNNDVPTGSTGTLTIICRNTIDPDELPYTVIVTFYPPQTHPPTPSTAAPYAVEGYLPLGQFDNDRGWGSISFDGDNKLTYPDHDAYAQNVKAMSGYDANGISIGSAGGYAQYKFATPILNTAANKYGVDFIIYGNAIPGLAEAGVVEVSQNGVDWYELAGSLYYDGFKNANTLHHVDVTYKRIDTTSSEFPYIGIYYKLVQNGAILCDWTFYTGAVGWWPDTGRYGVVSGIGTTPVPYADNNVTDVVFDTVNKELTYRDRTLVAGEHDESVFAFGYCDVHTDGSSYGESGNPYAAVGESGDGYDISWAVDENGNPYYLYSIKYIRVYTSASLDPTSATPIFVTPDPNTGEISSEICGVYMATDTGSGAITPAATVSYGTTVYTTLPVSDTQGITNVTLPAGVPSRTFTIDALSADNAYINSEKMTTETLTLTVALARGQTALYRIITQSADGNAYVNLVNFTRL
jgi:hypothetical protein